MKIAHIKIENMLGVKCIDASLPRQIHLFVGPNGAGKSSLGECVRMALTAESPRADRIKDYGTLVREGAKHGTIAIGVEGDEPYTVQISAAGKVEDNRRGEDVPDGLSYVLDPPLFAATEPNERRAFLFRLMHLQATPEAIKERLLKRGCDEAKVDAAAPILRSGCESAQKFAANKATECKGAWRGVTLETWGKVKGESWRAPVPAFSQQEAEELHGLDKAIAELDTQLADAHKRLGIAEHEEEQQRKHAAMVESLKATAAKFSEHQELVNMAEAALSRLQNALADLRQRAAGKKPGAECACPACGVSLVFHEGKLERLEQDSSKQDSDAAARIPDMAKAVVVQEKVLARHRANLNKADEAAKALAAVPEVKSGPKTKPEIIRETIATLKQDRDAKRLRQDELRRAHAALEAADEKTKQARQHHADVLAWSKIADALAPDGIPGEMLSEALKPINDRLRQSAADTSWQQVRIGPDMDITADNRPYRLLSESERWRADAMIAEAISHLSGLRLLVLDRLDVLDLDGRGDALSWLDVLAREQDIDTAIVLGTLKQVPSGLPDTMACAWIDAGELVEQREAVAA